MLLSAISQEQAQVTRHPDWLPKRPRPENSLTVQTTLSLCLLAVRRSPKEAGVPSRYSFFKTINDTTGNTADIVLMQDRYRYRKG